MIHGTNHDTWRLEKLLFHIIEQNEAILRILQTLNPGNAEVAAATAKLRASTDELQKAVAANTPKSQP